MTITNKWLAALVLLLALTLPRDAPATPLGTAAANLQPGTWTAFNTNNINTAMEAFTSNLNILPYAEEMKWDPKSKQLFFLGGDHNGIARFVIYDDASNTWKIPQQPSWIPSGTSHAYDHSAIDPQGRAYYHRPFSANAIHRYDIDNGTWTTLPAIPSSVVGYINCCVGLEYVPELKGLLWASETVALWSQDTNTWKQLAQNLSMGSYHHFAEYNPKHKVTVFGGGNGSKTFYKCDATGKISPLKAAPIGLGMTDTLFTYDPVSGDYLVIPPGESAYIYDVLTDSWKPLPGNVPLDGSANSVAAPIDSYGIVFFAECKVTSCGVWLYKHTPATSLPDAGPPPDKGATDLNKTLDNGGPGSDAQIAVDGAVVQGDGQAARPEEGCGCAVKRAARPRPLWLGLLFLLLARWRRS